MLGGEFMDFEIKQDIESVLELTGMTIEELPFCDKSWYAVCVYKQKGTFKHHNGREVLYKD